MLNSTVLRNFYNFEESINRLFSPGSNFKRFVVKNVKDFSILVKRLPSIFFFKYGNSEIMWILGGHIKKPEFFCETWEGQLFFGFFHKKNLKVFFMKKNKKN